jgi:hypothetical protein
MMGDGVGSRHSAANQIQWPDSEFFRIFELRRSEVDPVTFFSTSI